VTVEYLTAQLHPKGIIQARPNVLRLQINYF